MTVIQPPAFMQNLSNHTAETDRSIANVLTLGPLTSTSLRSLGGVNMSLGGGLKVTQSGSPAMSVDIATGCCLVPGGEGPRQGQYSVVNDASVTVTVTASHPTLPRIDLVTMTIQDQFYSGGTNQALLVVTAGTPASSPAVPAAPVNSIILAQIAVAAASVTVVNANITDRRTPIISVGGLEVFTSATRPSLGLYEGRIGYPTDRDWIEVYDGAAWRVKGSATVANFAALSNIPNPFTGQLVTDSVGTVWVYNGSIWVPDRITGNATISFTTQTSNTTVVSFGATFDSNPILSTNINNGSGSTSGWASRGISISTTGFTVFSFGPSSTWSSVVVQWAAFSQT